MSEAASLSIREARRRALTAVEIVKQHTGPWKTLVAWTQKAPVLLLAGALVVGIVSGRVVANR